jgi:hypothetical protein
VSAEGIAIIGKEANDLEDRVAGMHPTLTPSLR